MSLAAITVVAVVAIHQRRDAERQRNVAVSRELRFSPRRTLDADPELALRLALVGLDELAHREADAALRQATLAFHQLAALPADPSPRDTAAYSPDGCRVVTGGDDGVARVWDASSTARVIARLAGPATARSSPHGMRRHGQRIALGFADGTLLLTRPVARERRSESCTYGTGGRTASRSAATADASPLPRMTAPCAFSRSTGSRRRWS